MNKRTWKRDIWRAMAITLESDLYANGSHYLHYDEHMEPLTDKEKARMKVAAREVIKTMRWFAGGTR